MSAPHQCAAADTCMFDRHCENWHNCLQAEDSEEEKQ